MDEKIKYLPTDLIKHILSFRETHKEALIRKFRDVMQQISLFESRLQDATWPGYHPITFDRLFHFFHEGCEFQSKMLYVYSSVVNTYFKLKGQNRSILCEGSVTELGLSMLLDAWQFRFGNLEEIVPLKKS